MSPTSNLTALKVRRADDPFGIPACCFWTADEVADWLHSVGFGKYKENFRSHFIDGRRLIQVNASFLPSIGVDIFEDIKLLTRLIRDQLHIKPHLTDWDRYRQRRHYISQPHPAGNQHRTVSFQKHLQNCEDILDTRVNFFKNNSIYYSGWTMFPGWDKLLVQPSPKIGKRKTSEKPSAPTSQATSQATSHATSLAASHTSANQAQAGDLTSRLREAARVSTLSVQGTAASSQTRCDRKPTRQTVCFPMRQCSASELSISPVTKNSTRSARASIKPTSMSRISSRTSKMSSKADVSSHINKNVDTGTSPKIEVTDVNCTKELSGVCHGGVYLPVVFHWRDMQQTRGYPKQRLSQRGKCELLGNM